MSADFVIQIKGDGAQFRCAPGERVLIAMERAGLAKIPVGCRGGGCGICKIAVLEGSYHCDRMSRTHVSVEDESRGYALACRVTPDSDLRVEPLGKIFAHKAGKGSQSR